MKPGQKPKPTHLRILQGNPRGTPLNKHEPIPAGDLTTPPDWMTAEQQAAWRYAIEHAPKGLLKMLDASVLAVWVVAEGMHREATMQVTRTGMLVKSPKEGVPIQSPYLSIKNRQAHLMLRAAAELGFTPSSRSGIVTEHAAGNAFSNNGRSPRAVV